jgi:hypothetical protein
MPAIESGHAYRITMQSACPLSMADILCETPTGLPINPLVDEPIPFNYRENELLSQARRSEMSMTAKRRCRIIGVPMISE